MTYRYHLLIRSPFGTESLVHRHSRGWLLPIAAEDPARRPSEVVERAAARIGAAGLPIAVTYGTHNAHHREVDWLGVVGAAERCVTSDLEWVPIDELVAQPGMLDLQHAFVRRYLTDAASIPGYWRGDWPERAREWTDDRLGTGSSTTGAMHVFRCGPSYVAVRFETNRSPVYFKAVVPGNGFPEASVSHWLEQQAPDRFAPTLAIDECGGRWLAGHVEGTPLRGARSDDALACVTRDLAMIQMQLGDRCHELRGLGAWSLTLREIEKAGIALLERECQSGLAVDTISRTIDRIERLDLPDTWIPLDLVPDNVVMSGDRAVFIDVGDCWIGPAPAAIEVLLRCQADGPARQHASSGAPAERFKDLFVDAWRPRCSATALREGLALMPLLVCLVESLRGLEWVSRRTRQSEIAGFEERARKAAARRIMDATMQVAAVT